MSVDPLADKNIVNSPYAYCSGNPIMMIDPDGRDEWNIDISGNLVGEPIKNDQADIIRYVDNNGKTRTLENGQLAQFEFIKGEISYTTNEKGYTYFSIKGDEKGLGLFKSISQIASCEWSLFMTGEDTNGLNILGTSHQTNTNEAGKTSESPWEITKLRKDYHNHPGNNPEPSGLHQNGAKEPGSFGDIKRRDQLINKYGAGIGFYLYLPNSDHTIDYTNMKPDKK